MPLFIDQIWHLDETFFCHLSWNCTCLPRYLCDWLHKLLYSTFTLSCSWYVLNRKSGTMAQYTRNARPMWSMVPPASPNFICHFLREWYRRDYLLDYVCMFYVDVVCIFCIVFNLCAEFELVKSPVWPQASDWAIKANNNNNNKLVRALNLWIALRWPCAGWLGYKPSIHK